MDHELRKVRTSNLPLSKIGRGKVRDIYAVGDDRLLLVATDRISAFDVVMAEAIPLKGVVLTQMSAWWFRQLEGLVSHHMLAADAARPGDQRYPRRMNERLPALRERRS